MNYRQRFAVLMSSVLLAVGVSITFFPDNFAGMLRTLGGWLSNDLFDALVTFEAGDLSWVKLKATVLGFGMLLIFGAAFLMRRTSLDEYVHQPESLDDDVGLAGEELNLSIATDSTPGEDIEERLNESVTEVLENRGYSREDARSMIRNGEWTDNEYISSYFTDEDNALPPLRVRIELFMKCKSVEVWRMSKIADWLGSEVGGVYGGDGGFDSEVGGVYGGDGGFDSEVDEYDSDSELGSEVEDG